MLHTLALSLSQQPGGDAFEIDRADVVESAHRCLAVETYDTKDRVTGEVVVCHHPNGEIKVIARYPDGLHSEAIVHLETGEIMRNPNLSDYDRARLQARLAALEDHLLGYGIPGSETKIRCGLSIMLSIGAYLAMPNPFSCLAALGAVWCECADVYDPELAGLCD